MYLALSWLKCHAWWFKQECRRADVILEANRYVAFHCGRVADVHCLHVLEVPSLPILVPRFPAVEGTKLVLLFVHYVPLVYDFIFLNCLLATWINNPI